MFPIRTPLVVNLKKLIFLNISVSYQPYAQEELVQFRPEDSKRQERDSSYLQQQPKLTHPPYSDLDPRNIESQHPYSQNTLPSSDYKTDANYDYDNSGASG
jgi:hypothetical protein